VLRRLSTAQRFINRQLIEAARKDAVVVRLKGGDPMLFGRAQEEIDALVQAGIEVEIVPGISAAFAASAALSVSLTQRGVGRSVVLLTPRVGEGETGHDWARPAMSADTVVMYMASRQADAIVAGLMAAGMPAARPVAVVERASLPGERRLAGRLQDLPSLVARLGDGPALVMIGDVYAPLTAHFEVGSVRSQQVA
jgi:uroporphyrin-III C-methyltransferase